MSGVTHEQVRGASATAGSWESTPAPQEFAEREVPQIATEEVPECPVCRGTKFAQFAVGFDYEIQTCSNPWRLVRCDDCSHVWLNPRPAIAELSTIYPPSYYAYSFEDQVNPIAIRGKAMLDGWKMGGVFRALGRQPGSYLDVGCGSGRFLRTMEGRGVPRERTYGLELDPKVVEALQGEGYPVFCERVEECTSIETGSIDLITMFHVIEHVDDPEAVLRRLFELLAPGGVLALETPNIDSLDARIFKERFWGGYHIPRHWNLFSPSTMRRLLERCGYEVEDVSFQTGHSFWMYSMHHRLRYDTKRLRGASRWFDPLKGLPFLVAFTGFDKLRSTLGFRTSAMLVTARKK